MSFNSSISRNAMQKTSLQKERSSKSSTGKAVKIAAKAVGIAALVTGVAMVIMAGALASGMFGGGNMYFLAAGLTASSILPFVLATLKLGRINSSMTVVGNPESAFKSESERKNG